VGDAHLNLTEAAKMAGYKDAAKRAHALKRKYSEVFEAAEVAFREGLSMQAEEAMEGMAAIARDPDHKDRYNAIKTMLTLHGKLDPTLNLNVKRADLDKALDKLIVQLTETKAAEDAQQPSDKAHDALGVAAGDALPQDS
jgi:hypothetical protein